VQVEPGSLKYNLHLLLAMYLLSNIFFNYFMCASTRPGRPARLLRMPGARGDVDLEKGAARGGSGPAAARSHGHAGNGGAAAHGRGGNGGQSPPKTAQGAGKGNSRLKTRSRGAAVNLAPAVDHDVADRFLVLWKNCERCKTLKPPRTHHCSVCNECVLNMDHHCPWMNNCIGYYNYRYFWLFLCYLWVGCAYLIANTTHKFAATYRAHGQDALIIKAVLSERTAIVFCFVIAFSVAIALSFLWGWHVYLLFSGQSTIEFYLNRERRAYARSRGRLWRNPFDVGLRKNWEQVFGPGNPLLAMQISWRDPPEPITPFRPRNCTHDAESEVRSV